MPLDDYVTPKLGVYATRSLLADGRRLVLIELLQLLLSVAILFLVADGLAGHSVLTAVFLAVSAAYARVNAFRGRTLAAENSPAISRHRTKAIRPSRDGTNSW